MRKVQGHARFSDEVQAFNGPISTEAFGDSELDKQRPRNKLQQDSPSGNNPPEGGEADERFRDHRRSVFSDHSGPVRGGTDGFAKRDTGNRKPFDNHSPRDIGTGKMYNSVGIAGSICQTGRGQDRYSFGVFTEIL